MLPVKIDSYFDKPPPHQSKLGPGRLRPASPQPPKLVAVQGVAPDEDRRVSNRRTSERREKEQALFLDTRTAHTRRRNPGRRAEDQLAPEARKTISIKA
ncbi:hypothetical protein [Massilia sp. TSP1-1-2]|uniref:hypothetical protein n=1 Tax=unclassified Massilia TaxID=2609279 RepID=UPI003CEF9957